MTRYIGPYTSTKKASDDLQRVLASSSTRAKWQIHALESPGCNSLFQIKREWDNPLSLKAS